MFDNPPHRLAINHNLGAYAANIEAARAKTKVAVNAIAVGTC